MSHSTAQCKFKSNKPGWVNKIETHHPTKRPWAPQRTHLIGERNHWEDLDQGIWMKNGLGDEDIIDGGEEWFGHIFELLT